MPRLRSAGVAATSGPIMVEDAWRYYEEALKEDPSARITRDFLVSRARRNNRAAPRADASHLRLFIEIQQDGLRHVGRLELALIEPVRLERRGNLALHAVTWMKAEEAVELGVRIDREALRSSAEGLFNHFEADLKATH
jgi:hypothetical protein